jgi:hypothetical protein
MANVRSDGDSGGVTADPPASSFLALAFLNRGVVQSMLYLLLKRRLGVNSSVAMSLAGFQR